MKKGKLDDPDADWFQYQEQESQSPLKLKQQAIAVVVDEDRNSAYDSFHGSENGEAEEAAVVVIESADIDEATKKQWTA